MTGRVINLRAARKTAAREAARKQGDENAVKFGRSKIQKAVESAIAHRVTRHLDGHRLDRTQSDQTGGERQDD